MLTQIRGLHHVTAMASDARAEPGFERDEDLAYLGEALKLPKQHAHLRAWREPHLEPIT
jgi:hypothetical protein